MKTYLLKVDTQYLTADGQLSDAQADAMRVYAPATATARLVVLTPQGADRMADDDPPFTDDDCSCDECIIIDE